MTRFAWRKAMPAGAKADHVGELFERLRLVRGVGLSPATAARVHEERLRQLCREGQAVDTPSRYGQGSSSARFVVRRK